MDVSMLAKNSSENISSCMCPYPVSMVAPILVELRAAATASARCRTSAERPSSSPLDLPRRKDRARHPHVNSLLAVHDLGDRKIGGDAHQRIGIVARRALVLGQEAQHVEGSATHSDIEILV